jgi:hypothetical membrane protein
MDQPVDIEHRTPVPTAPGFPVAVTPTVVVGAALWASSIVYFVAQVIAQLAATRPYSPVRNLISDLGRTACGPDVCSPLHALVDTTFVVVGAFHLLGALAIYPALPRGRLRTAGTALVVLAGSGLIVAGLAPEDENPGAHATGAILGLISLNLAMIVLGRCLRPGRRWLGTTTLWAGILGLGGLFLLIVGAGEVPAGVAERLADYPGAAMIVVLGAYLLRSAARRGPDRR